MLFRSNPVWRNRSFQRQTIEVASGETFRVSGALNKSLVCLMIVLLSASYSWSLGPAMASQMILFGFAGFIVGLFVIFVPSWSAFTVPLYAVVEGLFLGGVSLSLNVVYPGIVSQAILSTLMMALSLLVLYRTGVIQVTDRMRSIVSAGLLALMGIYFMSFLLRLFGVGMSLAFSPFGFVINIVSLILGGLCLLVDFDNIHLAERHGVSRSSEWLSAFALMVTLIWIYIEMLQLLARQRD